MYLFKNSIPTAKKTLRIFITKPNRLMLLMETVAVYCEIHASLNRETYVATGGQSASLS
jgi:hypothetical protein